MPDLLQVISRRWRMMFLLTLAGVAAALLAALLSPKLYLATATAVPANSALSDKARIFNQNIEALYSEFGSPDELDRIEGTAQLDTVFLSVAKACNLVAHYGIDSTESNALEKAARRLQKASDVRRSGYGELKLNVWDKDNATAAALANGLLQTINAIHQRLQTENNKTVLQKLKAAFAQKLQAQRTTENERVRFESAPASRPDTVVRLSDSAWNEMESQAERSEELKGYRRLINEYELALQTSPKSLLVVEAARPSPWHDRPKTERNVLLAFVASLFFAVLLAVYLESRNKP